MIGFAREDTEQMATPTGSGLPGARRWWPAAVLALGAGLVPGGTAHGYRFWVRSVDASQIALAADAVLWRTDIWGPSGTLDWVVADSPGWTEQYQDFDEEVKDSPFQTVQDALPHINAALDAWSDIGTADIRWRIRGVEGDLPRARDHKNTVRIHKRDTTASYVGIFAVDGEIVECDVNLSPLAMSRLESWGLNILIHEFGHCLGLMHSPVFPTWDSSWRRRSFDAAVWIQDPKMSYGYDRNSEPTGDDILGASLLRPVPDWPAGVGSITGEVRLGGTPARFVRVFGTRITGGRLGSSASVFTNEEGRFTLEGLAPGRYLLAAGTMVIGSAYGSLLDGGATLGGRDRYLLTPITVTAGAETMAPPIALREGRERSSWVGE